MERGKTLLFATTTNTLPSAIVLHLHPPSTPRASLLHLLSLLLLLSFSFLFELDSPLLLYFSLFVYTSHVLLAC